MMATRLGGHLRPFWKTLAFSLAVLAQVAPAHAQGAPPVVPPPTAPAAPAPAVKGPSTDSLQQAALGAPPASHATLAPGDIEPPKEEDGGPAVPPPQDLPQRLSLDDALKIFRARGFGLLIADANIASARGDEKIAGAVPNPALNIGYGRVLGSGVSCAGGDCLDQYTIGISDQAGIEDSLSGKRNLRLKVAHAALAAAKLNRVDAQRTLEFQVKSAYFQTVQTQKAYDFAKDTQADSAEALRINQDRLTAGKINEGDFERLHSVTLEADQAVDAAFQALRQAKVALAFLMGVRGRVPDFDVDKDALKFPDPALQPFVAATTDGLVRKAYDQRPDLLAYGYQAERANASIALAKRQVFPDITASIQYTQTGTGVGAVQPPTIGIGFSAPIPVVYRMQGDILKAQADLTTQQLSRAQTAAQIASDVETAYAAYLGARTLVERMEGPLLKSSKIALDKTKLQYQQGKANLTDYLDARRDWISTNVEYIQDLTNYWTAVAQLEEAVGQKR